VEETEVEVAKDRPTGDRQSSLFLQIVDSKLNKKTNSDYNRK